MCYTVPVVQGSPFVSILSQQYSYFIIKLCILHILEKDNFSRLRKGSGSKQHGVYCAHLQIYMCLMWTVFLHVGLYFPMLYKQAEGLTSQIVGRSDTVCGLKLLYVAYFIAQISIFQSFFKTIQFVITCTKMYMSITCYQQASSNIYFPKASLTVWSFTSHSPRSRAVLCHRYEP